MPGTFNAGLLRIARQARGWSQAELSRQSGISQAKLSKLENGLTSPADDAIHCIAEVLKFPVSFFYQEDRIAGLPVSVHPLYRKKASIGKKPLEKLEALLNIQLLHLRRLFAAIEFEPELVLPKLEVDDYGDDPERIAQLVRQTWLAPSGPIIDLVGWVERAGCIVIHCDLAGLSVDGITMQMSDMPPCIFLNRNQPADRQRFSLAHELGHIVMHKAPSPTMEEEANAFAAALLMPAREIGSYLNRRLTIQRLAALKPAWKVSMAALLFRAKTIGAITANQSQYLWRQMTKMGYRQVEPPELDFAAEEPSIHPEIISVHIQNLGYDMNDLCAALHSFEDDVRRMHPLPARVDRPNLRLVHSRA